MTTGGPLTADRPTHVAVVIPAKDEAERIEATVRAAAGIAGVDMVVVVDDGSRDATSAVAKGAGALVVRHRSNRGKAAAMATGGRVVSMREETDRADGGTGFREELHAEPREPGHTGPLPVIRPDGENIPRALLFLDADMEASAAHAQPLVEAVLHDGVDMAIALLPPQEGAAGHGIVVRTARNGIRKATGWEPEQPLSGTRCITREAWEACQPLAPGWGVETSLTIDALTGGFWVKEIPCDLQHRATGTDLSGQLHRAAQLRGVVGALMRRRTVRPPDLVPTDTVPSAPTSAPAVASPDSPDGPAEAPSSTPATLEPGPDLAQRLAELPVDGPFSTDQQWALVDTDVEDLRSGLVALPVDGPFEPDDAVFLAGVDLEALQMLMDAAPVEGPFEPEHAVLLATDLSAAQKAAATLTADTEHLMDAAEFTSRVVDGREA